MFKKIKRELKLLKECWDEVSEYHKSDGPSEPHEYVNNESEETNMFGCTDILGTVDYNDVNNIAHESYHPNHPEYW